MTDHHNYDVGWMVRPGDALAHYYKSSTTSNLAIAHCGWMALKCRLVSRPTADRCGYCQAVEDMRGDDDGLLHLVAGIALAVGG
jgi:hypothetical protein